jgi:DNA-binding transcriptional ArsR family regulator
MANPNRRFKDAIYEQFARIGKAVSSPKRLELLDLLCQGPRTVEVLANEASLTVANTSRHLNVLRRASLVEAEKDGLFVTYRLADPSVCALFRDMRLLAEKRLGDIERITRNFLEGREGL